MDYNLIDGLIMLLQSITQSETLLKHFRSFLVNHIFLYPIGPKVINLSILELQSILFRSNLPLRYSGVERCLPPPSFAIIFIRSIYSSFQKILNIDPTLSELAVTIAMASLMIL
jgi:hypothetical protein